MNRLSLTFRFLIPVGAALSLFMAALIWDVGTAQVRRAESAFKEELTALAVSSRFMLHAAAAGYCRSRGMVFHRVRTGQVTAQGPAADFERAAMQAFDQDPSLTSRSFSYRAPDGTPQLYVLAPAKLQPECATCHAASGVTAFAGRRDGELVGAFGVSVSTEGLHRNVLRTRLVATEIGLGALVVIALIVTYFVHRSILLPLSELAGAIGQMGRGDLMARAPVHRRDEIGRLAESFNGMVAQLRQANQNYMEVLAFVSHELKNPIASMLTDARVLADGYLGPMEPAQVRKLERLIGMGNHLLEVIREYLDLAQMESGHLPFRPRTADLLEEVVDPAVELILPQIQDRRMNLERDPVRDFEPVECDPHLLRIVLVNLLGNAVKYGRPEGTIRLTVDLGAGRMRIVVWNEGPGFPAEERPRLFRKFSRLQNPELSARKGTGIGLYTAWRIAGLHGGSMDARSEQGRWAEFSLEIPQPLPPAPGEEEP